MKINWSKVALKIITVLVAISSFLPSGLIAKKTPMRITVNPNKQIQTIDGWGTSACWWSQKVSDPETRTELAKLLYSKEGLGLNIYRYNVGGGVNPEHNRVGNPWRTTESFYYYNDATGKYEYDFTRDANAQAFLDEALKYGCIDTVVLFCNSPHYSMTISQEASGSYEAGGVSNLAPEHYQDFVDYLLTITEYFIKKGVPVKYISPINEPQWDWGGEWVGQEGCHYNPDQVLELLKLFSKGIDERGLDVKLSVPDSGSLGQITMDYFNAIASDPDLYKNVGTFAYHSYWADPDTKEKEQLGNWIKKNALVSAKKVEMSEWCELPLSHDCDDIKGAAIMGRVISNDIRYTKVNSWTNWVAVNQYGLDEEGKKNADSLIWSNDDFTDWGIAARYYAYGNYSKFIPAGSKVIDSTTNKNGLANYNWYTFDGGLNKSRKTTFTAYQTPEGKIVVVIVNEDDAKKINIDISKNTKAKPMEVYTTDADHKLELTYTGETTNNISIAADSITTVVIG